MSGQNTLVVIAEDNQVERPGHKWNWQVYRDTSAPGSGVYKAMDKNGVIEIIGGPGVGDKAYAYVFNTQDVVVPDNEIIPFNGIDNNQNIVLGPFIKSGVYNIILRLSLGTGDPSQIVTIAPFLNGVNEVPNRRFSVLINKPNDDLFVCNFLVQINAGDLFFFRNISGAPINIISQNQAIRGSVTLVKIS